MDFEGFAVLEFPRKSSERKEFVYVFCWIDGGVEVPFYVGQTSRMWGRLDDYYWAVFSACTDFRVGEAIRYLCAKGYRVVVRYKQCADGRACENDIIGKLHQDGRTLLNDAAGYDYRTAIEADERKRIQVSVEALPPGRCQRCCSGRGREQSPDRQVTTLYDGAGVFADPRR